MSLTRYSRDAEHFVTAIPFEWDGKRYETGELFPAIALGLSEFKRRELWVANKITVADGPSVAASAPAAPPVVDPAPPVVEPTAPPAKAKPRPRAGA